MESLFSSLGSITNLKERKKIEVYAEGCRGIEGTANIFYVMGPI